MLYRQRVHARSISRVRTRYKHCPKARGEHKTLGGAVPCSTIDLGNTGQISFTDLLTFADNTFTWCFFTPNHHFHSFPADLRDLMWWALTHIKRSYLSMNAGLSAWDTHFNPFTRSHATPRISHAEKEITCPAHEQLVNRRGNTLCRVHSSLDSQS